RDAGAPAPRSRAHRPHDRRRARRARGGAHGRGHPCGPGGPAPGRRPPGRRDRGPPADSNHERGKPMNDFTVSTPTQEPEFDTAMKVVYQWNYGSEVEELRRLYVKAAEAQWVAERDIDWDRPIDLEKFAMTPVGGGAIPIERNSYWKSLDEETRIELMRRTAAFRL